MRFLKKGIMILMLMSVLSSLSSCSSEYGTRIEENLDSTNIIEDNYRNFYEIFVSSFYDHNGDQKGDLLGVVDKLDYIKDMGFTGIWLMPIYPSPSYHKYDAADYFSVDSSYGTLDDFDLLIKEAHKRGIKVIIDLMLNHSSNTHPLFLKSVAAFLKYKKNEILSEEEEIYKDFYVLSLESNPYRGRSFASTKVDGTTIYYEDNFAGGGMPEFNFDSIHVRNMFKDVAKFWLKDHECDGFRLDAGKYIYFNDDKSSMEYLDEFNDYCKSIKKDSYLVCEVWSDVPAIRNYYKNTNLDSYFWFPNDSSWQASLNRDGYNCDKYLKFIEFSEEAVGDNISAPFWDNHDMARKATTLTENAKFTYALLAMLNGATFTYYGDEIALTSKSSGDPNYRTYMYRSKGNFEGKCRNSGGGVDKYENPPVDEQEADPLSMLNLVKKANLLRNQLPVIARGKLLKSSYVYKEEDEDNFDEEKNLKPAHIVFVDKEYKEQKIRIIINFRKDSSYTYSEYNNEEVVGQLVCVNDKDAHIGIKDKKLIIPPYSLAILNI